MNSHTNPPTVAEVKLRVETLRLEVSDPAIPERERKIKRAELADMINLLKWIKESLKK